MDGARSGVRYLSDEDCFFLENVMIDIRAFIQTLNITKNKKKVLLLPPVNNFRRFLVHKLVEETFCRDNLSTLSVGKLYGRRTVIFPSYLTHMDKDDCALTTIKNANPNVTEESKKKSSSAPIYRPPAVRKRENIARTSILNNKDKKNRKPDLQIYVPRAKRQLSTQSVEDDHSIEVQDENKSDNDIQITDGIDTTSYKVDESLPSASDDIESRSFRNDINKDLEFIKMVKASCKKDNNLFDSTIPDVPIEKEKSVTSREEYLKCYPNEDSIGFKSKRKSKTTASPKNVGKTVSSDSQSSKSTNELKDDVEILSVDESSCQSSDSIIEISSLSSIANESPNHDDIQDFGDFSFKSDSTLNTPPKKTEKSGQSSSANKSLDVESCDWEELFNEDGEYVDQSLIDELMTAIGKVSVQRATRDYRPYQTEEERSTDGECIIEVYGFPSEFRTEDLFNAFTPYRSDKGFQIVWVDDTHALAVFSSPIIADEVLNTQLPFVKTRPLKNAIAKSKIKASNFVLPPVTRPKTCVSLARRLVSGHLGMKVNVTPKQREAERKLLSDAREHKRLMAKQKFDAWEGSSSTGK